MENEWRARLTEAIRESKQSKRQLSLATGYGENFVQQMLKDEKDPAFPRLAKLLSILGVKATLYVMLGIKPDAESQLRAALLAYGVDQKQFSVLIPLINKFLIPSEELSGQTALGDQSRPSSPRHEVEPSHKKARQPAS